MVMQSRDKTYNKYRTEVSVSPYGVTTTNNVLAAYFRDALLVYNNGVVYPINRSKPHNFRYLKTFISYWDGQVHSYAPPSGTLGAQEYHETGPSGGQPTLATYTQKEIDAIVAEALSRLFDKLRGTIDLSIDLGQRQQTIALARHIAGAVAYVRRHPLQALRRSFDYFETQKRRNRYGRTYVIRGSVTNKQRIRDASSLWLEYTYGLKPTLQTIYDTIVELARSQEPLMKVTGRAKQVSRRFVIENGYVKPWAHTENNQLLSARYQYVCRYRHSAGTLNLLSRFSSLNPASIAWELMPFSFVVDWFVDVGGYMRNLETSILSSSLFKDGYTTFSYAYETYGRWTGHLTGVDGSYQYIEKTGSYILHQLVREVLTVSPSPKLPHFQADLSSGRLLNAAALLGSFFRGK